MDFVSKEKRSAIMRGVKQRNTKPEMVVRSALHGLGFRFRLHVKDLPGKPDIVLAKYRLAIFVHGCFWHQHSACPTGQRQPTSNTSFWAKKFASNVARDARRENELRELGWNVGTIWECQAAEPAELTKAIRSLLPRRNTRSRAIRTP